MEVSTLFVSFITCHLKVQKDLLSNTVKKRYFGNGFTCWTINSLIINEVL